MNWPLVVCIGILLALFGVCIWVIAKPPFEKRGSGFGGAQFTVQSLMQGLMDKSKQKAIEYMIYEQEDAEREDDEGDDIGRFEGESNDS